MVFVHAEDTDPPSASEKMAMIRGTENMDSDVSFTAQDSAVIGIPKNDSPVIVSAIEHHQNLEKSYCWRGTGKRQISYRKQRRCSVMFDQDSNLNDRITYIEPSLTLTELDSQNCWWSKQETLDMCRDAKRVANLYRDRKADTLREFNRFFKLANIKTSKTRPADKEMGRLLQSLLQADCRGLERVVYPVITRYRMQHAKTLLRIQAKIPSEVPPGSRERLLSVISARISKPSRIMAKLLARCDSCHVTDLLKQELRENFSL